MKKLTGKNKIRLQYAVSFLLPVLLVLSVFAIKGFYPFGDSSILTGDLQGITLPMYADYKAALLSGDNLLYTFSKHLGGSQFSSTRFFCFLEYAYLLFDTTQYAAVALFIFTAYSGFAGLSCYYALTYFNKKRSWFYVALSTGYAMMNYLFAYGQCIRWMHFLPLLPLLLILVDKFVTSGKWLMYALLLWYTINSFYYIAYMICLFIVLFFFYRLLLSKQYLNSEKKAVFVLKKTAGIAGASLLSVAGSAFYLVPTVLSASEKKGGLFSSEIISLQTNYNPLNLFSKLGIGNFSWINLENGLPLLYCGALATVLLLAFFLSKKIEKREKVVTGVMLAAMFLMSWSKTLNLFWHGSYPPTWFPYRYSFIICFFLVFVAARGLAGVEGLSPKRFFVMLGGLVAFTVLGFLFTENTPNILRSALTLFFFIFYSVSVYLLLSGRISLKSTAKKLLPVAIVAVLCLELILNSYFTLSVFEFYSNSGYRQVIEDNRQVISYIHDLDDNDFYRMDKNFFRTMNDPMLFGYYGLSHFSSYADSGHELMYRLGYENFSSSNFYGAGSTAFADAYLGVRYLWADDNPEHQVGAHFRLINDQLPYNVYQNDYTFPAAFITGQDVLEVNMDAADTFDLQQDMLRALSGIDEDYFVKYHAETSYNYNNAGKYADYTFEATVDGWCYAVLRAENPNGMMLLVNDTNFIGTYPTTYFEGVINLGYFQAGESVTLSCISYDEVALITYAVFCSLDESAFLHAVDAISQRSMQDTVIENGYASGSVQANAGEILSTTIPYEEGWVVTVNGNPAQVVELFDCMMGVVLEQGTNQIEMRYTIVGFKTGIIISCFAATVYIGFVVVNCIKKKRKKAETSR